MSAVMKESITDSELQRDVLDELKWDPGPSSCFPRCYRCCASGHRAPPSADLAFAKTFVAEPTRARLLQRPEEAQQALDGLRSLIQQLP